MSTTLVDAHLRRFLLGLTAFIFIGTVIELWLSDHTNETLQWIPFILSAMGFLAVGAVWLRPSRQTIRVLRGVMTLVALGSIAGIYFHLNGNFEFELEMRPGASATDVIMEALKGADPLLAPGILALAALLAIAATYYHPALQDSSLDETG